MSDRWIIRVLAVAAVAVILVLAVPVLAQETQQEPGETQTTEEEAIEEAIQRQQFAGEIIVTSRRMEENIQEVPIAVTVVTGDQLLDVQATDISELDAYVPNVSIYQGRNQSTTLTAFIRGVGQSDPLWGVDPGVGLYIDDVYIARGQGALLDVYDVARVEVLRGPQGTLYGKNTIGGAIKYVTKPLSDTPEGKFSLGLGNYGTQEYRFNLSGPIIEGKLRGKIAAAKLLRDGYGRNLYQNRDVSDKNTMAYRAALEWLPAENVSLQFNFDRTEDDAEPLGWTRLESNPYCLLFGGFACDPFPNLFDVESGIDPVNDVKSTGYSMTLAWDISEELRFKSITARRETDTRNWIDFDTSPLAIADSEATYYDDQTTQEFQLLYTGSGRLNGVVGLYYFDGTAGGEVEAIFYTNFPNTTTGHMDTKSYAIYADANVGLTDRLTLNLGLRPTREKKHGVAFNVYNTPPDDFSSYYFVAADFDDETTFTSWAPKIGLDYKFNEDVMGYVTVNRGFKSGGYNVRAQATAFPDSALPFDDEVMTVAEVGVKSVLANRSLLLNADVFYGNYTDIQVSTFTDYDSDGDGTNDAFYGDFLNAGDATISGIELEYNWASQSWFGLSGFLAYLKTDPDFLDENGDGVLDAQVISNAPEFTGAIRGNFDFPAFGGLITASVGYSYRDDAILTNEGVNPIVQPAYGLVDAWVSWLSGNAKWRIGVSGKNLTDKEYLISGYNLPVLGAIQGYYGAPRTFVGTIEFRFF